MCLAMFNISFADGTTKRPSEISTGFIIGGSYEVIVTLGVATVDPSGCTILRSSSAGSCLFYSSAKSVVGQSTLSITKFRMQCGAAVASGLTMSVAQATGTTLFVSRTVE